MATYDDKLMNLARSIAKDAMRRHPHDLRNQADEVESASYLAVAQAMRTCPCLSNDRPSYSPLARLHAYSLLEQELVRSCLLPVRLKDGSPVSNWIGDAAGDSPCPGLGAEVLDSLNAAVAKLDADERALLHQLWVECLDIEEIAEESGLKPNTVRGHVNAVIDKLAEYMEKR